MNLNRNEGGRMQRSRPARIATIVIAAVIFALTSASGSAGAANSDPVVATVGSHRITQQEMDAKMLESISPTQLYDLRKNALDSLINDYLLEQAATRAHLTPDQYLKIALEAPRVAVASTGHPSLGAKDAPITMVEFGDFQCPDTAATENSVKEVRAKYGNKLRIVYMDFPLGIHEHAMDAANAARCAGEQDKFWQYHDAIFADQSKLAPADLKASAAKLGLNAKKFDACLEKAKYQPQIQQDMAEATKLGVTGTPTFFINGREITGAQPAQKFEDVIDDEIAKAEHPAAQRQASAKQ